MFLSVSATRTYCAFILRMEFLVLLQRKKLNSPDNHKLTNIKDNTGQNSLYRATCSSNYIPCILNSHILSEHWVHFLNEHIIQTNVETHCSYLPIVGRRSNNDSGHNEESYDEGDSKYGPDGGPSLAWQERHHAPAQ